VASEDQFHDLALSRRQIRDVARRSLPPGGQLARIPRLFKSVLDACEQFAAADRLLDEVRAPAFMASTAIGTSLLPVIMMAGSRWPASLGAAAIPARSSRQVGVDQKACFAARSIGFEEFLAG